MRPTPIHLGRDERDSAGDDLSTHYWKEGEEVVAKHWGQEERLTPTAAIEKLERKASEARAVGGFLSAEIAERTIQEIRKHFNLEVSNA